MSAAIHAGDFLHAVKIYSTSTCPFCILAKSFFNKSGIPFQDVDVSADKSAAQEMIEKSGQMGVPVIDIDGKVIVGFNLPQIRKALGLE